MVGVAGRQCRPRGGAQASGTTSTSCSAGTSTVTGPSRGDVAPRRARPSPAVITGAATPAAGPSPKAAPPMRSSTESPDGCRSFRSFSRHLLGPELCACEVASRGLVRLPLPHLSHQERGRADLGGVHRRRQATRISRRLSRSRRARDSDAASEVCASSMTTVSAVSFGGRLSSSEAAAWAGQQPPRLGPHQFSLACLEEVVAYGLVLPRAPRRGSATARPAPGAHRRRPSQGGGLDPTARPRGDLCEWRDAIQRRCEGAIARSQPSSRARCGAPAAEPIPMPGTAGTWRRWISSRTAPAVTEQQRE